jgi:hypothetical protein
MVVGTLTRLPRTNICAMDIAVKLELLKPFNISTK